MTSAVDVTVMVVEPDSTGDTTMVAVFSHGSVTVTVVPPITAVFSVEVVKTVVLVLHTVQGSVAADSKGVITVTSVVSHGSVTVTVVPLTTDVLVVNVVKTIVLVLHLPQVSFAVAADSEGVMTVTSVVLQGSVTVTVEPSTTVVLTVDVV